MSEIKLKQDSNGTFHAIYNDESFAVHRANGSRESKELIIKVDTSDETTRTTAESGSISHPCLMTRFELGYEGGGLNVKGITIEKSDVVTPDDTYVLKVFMTQDYRARVGGRKQDFQFVVENCMASIHVEETKVGEQKLYYLVIKNISV